MKSNHPDVSKIRYTQPILNKDNSTIYNPDGLWTPIIDEDNICYTSLFKPFNLSHYLSPRLPIDMGLMNIKEFIIWDNVLRLPLKFPGTEYRIPGELNGMLSLIKRVAEYEKLINPNHDDCFCHVTYDNSTVNAGDHHRFPGWHGDGIQGTKISPKVNVEHSYIIVTDPPTEFCLQPFFLKHLDEAKHNFFLEFDRQAKKANVYKALSNHLYLIDPYMVHRTPNIKKRINRTFIRITYCFTELQHPKNTLNPLFEGQEYHKRIDIRNNLMPNEFKPPYHLYGISK